MKAVRSFHLKQERWRALFDLQLSDPQWHRSSPQNAPQSFSGGQVVVKHLNKR